VKGQRAYQALSVDPRAEIAIALQRANVDHVLKVWTELAYESVRLTVAPDAPSRLESLYAYLDPLEALSFPLEIAEGRQIWRGAVADGVRWSIVDMSAFSSTPPATNDASGFQTSWDEAAVRARDYWQPRNEIRQAEVLIAGAIQLAERLNLLAVLRTLGLVV